MSVVNNYFERYKANSIKWKDCNQALWNNLPKDKWIVEFTKSQMDAQNMYDENNEITGRIIEIANNLNDDTAADLYYECMKMHYDEYNDSDFLVYLAKKLLEFYIPKQDKVKLIDLYSLCQNQMIYISNPEIFPELYDMSFIRDGMSFIKDYMELPEASRYRLHVLYYTYLIRLLDYGKISLKEALDCYDEFMSFLDREEVKELNKNSDKINNVIEYTKNTFSIGILRIDDADPETRKRFYNYICDYFSKYFDKIESQYELEAEEYACFEYKEYCEGKIDADSIFDNFFDYFKYKFDIISNQTSFEVDDILGCINAITILYKLCNSVGKSEYIDKYTDLLTEFAEGRWIKGNMDNLPIINDMLLRLCISLLAFDIPGIDKNKCIKQLIIQRNLNCYIKDELVASIAISIYREIAATHIEFFDSCDAIPKTNWKEYLYYASLFHEIGINQVSSARVMFNRPLLSDEKERRAYHIIAGRKIISQIPYMKRYDDIVNGHHMYYNGKGGYSDNFDRDKCQYKPFLDIVSLAVYIEEATNNYFNFNHSAISFDKVIDLLKDDKGTRFNDEIVNILLKSTKLQVEIKNIVTNHRLSVIYESYHNWEKIQISQDEDSILAEIDQKLLEYRDGSDAETIKPYISKAMDLAYTSKRERTRGYALFYVMRYYFIIGDYTKALTFEADTNRLLEAIHNNELLIKNYINCAGAEIMRENLDGAMSKYLMALELAKRTPECAVEQSMALASIANIYAKVGNFKKATEYYKQVDDSNMDPFDYMQLLCMEGFCYVKVGNIDNVKELFVKLKNVYKENENINNYAALVYLALFSYNLGNAKELELYLGKLKNIYLSIEELKYDVDEVTVYLDLLEEIGDTDLLAKQLDYYIDLCSGKRDFSQVSVNMVSKRLKIFNSETKSQEVLHYESMLYKALALQSSEKAEHMEEMEKTFLENIKLQSEHADFLTERSVLEQSVIKAKNESEQKSQFLSSMSHEIRTPINAILGLNEMILRECNDDVILQYATDINNAGKQLLGIVNDVLDYSKIEAGKMEISPQRYNIGELINDIKNMIEPKLNEKNLSYDVKYNSEIPYVLFGDDLRIKQILLNLLSNAYKYTNNGSVQFIVDYKKIDHKTISLHFEVTDTGVGMTPEQIQKLAQPFERFENDATRGVEGTGLGMSIVNKLLEEMNSHLSVSSTYGQGSTFSFDLVQGVIEWGRLGMLEDVKRKAIDDNSSKNKKSIENVIAPEAKILVVDDNAVNLKVIRALLKRNQVQVTTAFSGKQCLELCQTEGFHLIFLDHMMPELDGIQTLDILKKAPGPNMETPVVVLTANVIESGDDLYKKAGFDDFLTKPIDVEKLEDTLRRFLPDYLIKK